MPGLKRSGHRGHGATALATRRLTTCNSNSLQEVALLMSCFSVYHACIQATAASDPEPGFSKSFGAALLLSLFPSHV